MTNCEILWHTIGLSLSYICCNFDIEIETIVKCLKQLVSYKKTIAKFTYYSVFKYDWCWINLWSMELMTQASSAVERLARKHIVRCQTLTLVNRVLFGKKQEDFDSSKNSETKFGTAIPICRHISLNLKYIVHYGSLLANAEMNNQ